MKHIFFLADRPKDGKATSGVVTAPLGAVRRMMFPNVSTFVEKSLQLTLSAL